MPFTIPFAWPSLTSDIALYEFIVELFWKTHSGSHLEVGSSYNVQINPASIESELESVSDLSYHRRTQ